VDTVLLVCGSATPQPSGFAGEVVPVPERPGKKDVDPLLVEQQQRLVVAGSDADFAAVALRLLRKDRLADTDMALLPTHRRSRLARRWGIPTRPSRALALAERGTPSPVPLIRDDAGGVLVAHGAVAPIRAVAYCEEQLVLRAPARELRVQPSDPAGAGLAIRITARGLLRRRRSYEGRALQLGFDPDSGAVPVLDGVPRERPINRWTWYRHTTDLRLVRP